MKHIIATTDFLDQSTKAFPYAVALAERFKNSLLLLNIRAASLHLELSLVDLSGSLRERMQRFLESEFDWHLGLDTMVSNGEPAY